MSTPTLTQLHQQLDAVMTELAADREALNAQEAVVARAAEQLSQSAAVQAAWQQASDAMRWKVLAMIDHQLTYLQAGCVSHQVLDTLRRQVVEVRP
jgi:hypothetical protein